VKRIDHNKELAGGDVGWGWNQAAAQERARDYKWNADDLVFNIGAQLNQARQSSDNADWSEHIERFGKFWLISVVAIAVLEALVVVTALSIGMPKACAIWAAILGTIMLLGVVVSLKTDDWNFPAGTLLSIVALVALLGGLVASDMLVQAKWIKVWDCDDSSGDGVTNPELAACNKAGMYRFQTGTVVDTSQVHRGSSTPTSICIAPIVPQAWVDSTYSVDQVHYWAVDAECCDGDQPTCAGWKEEGWVEGVNWYRPDRPSAVFLKQEHLSMDDVFKAIQEKTQGQGEGGGVAVAVEWRQSAEAYVSNLYDVPAWLWLVVVSLLWPLVLSLLYTAVTLGSCIFLPRLHCHQPLQAFCLYVGSGCPSCWSELDIMPD